MKTEEIRVTPETRAIVNAYMERKNRIRLSKKGLKIPAGILIADMQSEQLSALDTFIRAVRNQKTIMSLQDSRRDNYSNYQSILQKELAEMKSMDDIELLKQFGYEEALAKLERYLQRYNS